MIRTLLSNYLRISQDFRNFWRQSVLDLSNFQLISTETGYTIIQLPFDFPKKKPLIQSILDLAVSMTLLLVTLLIRDTHVIHQTGVLGEIECRVWNSQAILWGLFDSSTWNLVTLTFERCCRFESAVTYTLKCKFWTHQHLLNQSWLNFKMCWFK